MKKGYIRIFIFDLFILALLLLNSFISSILSKYIIIGIFAVAIVLFKVFFGLEKDRHRYIKDICLDFLRIMLLFFIIYYLFGLYIGFTRTGNYFTSNGMISFIIPILLMFPIREYLRYQILQKSEGSKFLIVFITLIFIFAEVSLSLSSNLFTSAYNIFLFIALYLLPAISSNIVCTYVSMRLGYKANILWLFLLNIYYYILPIVPNSGEYIESLILLLLPLILFVKVYNLSEKIDDLPLERNYRKIDWILILTLTFITVILVYFTSGLFRYHVISVGSGSMYPAISKGDAVLIDRKIEKEKIKKGEIIAYKYGDRTIVHRLEKKEKDKNKIYYYTKGDNNNAIDNYPIEEDMIVGKVKIKIKYIGLPAVWLNNL